MAHFIGHKACCLINVLEETFKALTQVVSIGGLEKEVLGAASAAHKPDFTLLAASVQGIAFVQRGP